MATKKHQDFLNSHCRVCSRALCKTRYRTTKYELLLEYWGVDPTSDITDVHPQFFCNSCYLTSKKLSGSKDRGVCFEWSPHNDQQCHICDNLCKGGRPKRKWSSGRPTNISQHINSIASPVPNFTLNQLLDDQYKAIVTCCQCHSAAIKPIELLPCKSIICCTCSLELAKSQSFNCPGCLCDHPSNEDTFTRLSPLTERLFNDINVICEHCNCKVKLVMLGEECRKHQDSHQVSLNDVLQSNDSRIPTDLEKKAALSVVSKLVQQSDSGTLQLSTKGRVSIVYIIFI